MHRLLLALIGQKRDVEGAFATSVAPSTWRGVGGGAGHARGCDVVHVLPVNAHVVVEPRDYLIIFSDDLIRQTIN